MFTDFLLEVFSEFRDEEALVWHGDSYDYAWLGGRIPYWVDFLRSRDISPGTVVALEGDFSPNSVALFLALVENGCITVPLTKSVAHKRDQFVDISEVQMSLIVDEDDQVQISTADGVGAHPLYDQLRDGHRPGLVLFSSGSTGESKASVHDFASLLEKFKIRRRRLRTISFLLYDHIGGINTMLYALSNGGCLITVKDRSPDAVLDAVDSHRVALLPTSPTFVNLILLSEAYKRHDLSSLEILTYGTEPMPESTLKRFHDLFPDIRLQQTYGLSEVGILRSKSRGSDSLWVKVGGEGFETRIVDGILQIRAESAMLGYLNAESPFTADGWFNTEDAVLVDGEYIKILGRESEIINVGGEKVYPSEVENVIQQIDGVEEVTVFGQPNAIVGNIVCAKLRLRHGVDPDGVSASVKKYCRDRLEPYKVPMKVVVDDQSQHGARFKKDRANLGR